VTSFILPLENLTL